MWQAQWVADTIAHGRATVQTRLVKIRTLAEKFPEREVAEIGTGIFTRELDEALLEGKIDVAVHSMKDVPSEIPKDLVIAAVPRRESALDAFISVNGARFAGLPRGARVGTGSPRRKAQLLHHRPDLEIVPLRGNVATRLRKMAEEGLSATILAHAGLRRLGQEGQIAEVLGLDVLVPAVGQGALCIMTRADHQESRELLAKLEHAETRLTVNAERAFLRRLRGGCLVPAGALAVLESGGGLHVTGVVAAVDGSSLVRGGLSGLRDDGEALGTRLAEQLLERGGAEILSKLRSA
jgi:hydroxymethylbilane synthase